MATVLTAGWEFWRLLFCQGFVTGSYCGVLFGPVPTVASQWFKKRRLWAFGITATGSWAEQSNSHLDYRLQLDLTYGVCRGEVVRAVSSFSGPGPNGRGGAGHHLDRTLRFAIMRLQLVRVRARLKRRLLSSFPPGFQAKARSSQTYYLFLIWTTVETSPEFSFSLLSCDRWVRFGTDCVWDPR